MSRVHKNTGSLAAFIAHLPIVDVHEHHIPSVLLRREVGLHDLFYESYAGWTQTYGGMPPPRLEEECRGLARFLEDSGSNAFVRNLVAGISELYELGSAGLTLKNWQRVDAEVRRRHLDPKWVPSVLRRAGVSGVITDVYPDPLLDVAPALGDRYRSVMRINAFALGWHPASRDHNGTNATELYGQLGIQLQSFAEVKPAIRRLVETLASRNQVGIKNALAYDCDLSFDPPDERRASRAWGKSNPSAQERKAFIDFVVDAFCAAAAENDVPMQMHVGTARLRGSSPLRVAGLIERHPGTRFLLMHLGYPWSSELLAMAFAYRNVWIDLSWSFLLSPSHFQRAFAEAIEVLPDESRMMLGGDNWHAEETFASLMQARRLIAEVLRGKVRSGYFSDRDARRLAVKIFYKNAIAFFKLPQATG